MAFQPGYAASFSPVPHCPIAAASESLAVGGGIEARGAIFTRAEVVEFMLDLCGYTADQPLHKLRLLEPSFGGGDFLLPIINRLLKAWRMAGSSRTALEDLADAIVAIELHRDTSLATARAVEGQLLDAGLPIDQAKGLVESWLKQGDFLLADLQGPFDYVVGNPPYVRQELIPAPLLAEYRRRYATIFDRADLYIPFIERSLTALKPGGTLAYICADRWMKNRYGGPLRKFVAENYRLKIYVDMTATRAFHTDVEAYPAITIISREKPGLTRVAHRPDVTETNLRNLAKTLTSAAPLKCNEQIRELACVTNGTEPWLLESSDQTALVRRLEQQFPTIEQVGCKVGIGVATGADKAFIADCAALDVEHDRKVPLVTTKDIVSGVVEWKGRCVINPYKDEGGLVDLANYPKLAKYLNANREIIEKRHCAKNSPKQWYRTIDRITPALATKPKLLIPDIKGEAHVVYEDGKLYPHHNLYYITSSDWDLRALQAVLLSSISRLFVSMYSTKMRGGFLRFQAQYIRRIRLPEWNTVPVKLRKELSLAAEALDVEACNKATFELYKLDSEEIAAIGGTGKG